MPLEIQFLPAGQGDAVWVRWGHARQMLIDLGTSETGAQFKKRLEMMAVDRRAFDLFVITHVDGDHIGGALSAFVHSTSAPPGVSFRDVWFNGWANLSGLPNPLPGGDSGVEAMGPAQGEEFSKWLQSAQWNEAFDRGPVEREPDGIRALELGEGLTVKVLGPSRSALENLKPAWRTAVEEALASGRLEEAAQGINTPDRLERYGAKIRPRLDTKTDLELLARTRADTDPSKSNASSIVLLLEWHGCRILLTGDARAVDIVDGLTHLKEGNSVTLDLVKVPHHGSIKNVSQQLIEAVNCPYWVFSSDGALHGHPDAPAVARVLYWGRHKPVTLGFNVPSEFNEWWSDPRWKHMFSYATEYGSEEDGLVLTFSPKE